MVKRVHRGVSVAGKPEMPGFIKPQLATLKAKAPVGSQWLHVIKFDGVSSSPIDGSFYFTPAASSAASPMPDKPQSDKPTSESQQQEARLTEPGQSLSPESVTDCDPTVFASPALNGRSVFGWERDLSGKIAGE
jgi:hypothetical protein